MTLAHEITRTLGGDWHGSYGSVPDMGHSHRDRGLTIKPHADQHDDFVVHSHHGYPWKDVKDDVRQRAGLERPNPGSSVAKVANVARVLRSDAGQKRARAEAIWNAADRYDYRIGDYLGSRSVSRGLCDQFRLADEADGGPFSNPHGFQWPALVARVSSHDDKFLGVHVTQLALDCRSKAPTKRPRIMFGPIRGGAVRLHPTIEDKVVVGEGIETVLSYMKATGIPGLAALSTSGLINLELADGIKSIIIAADRDANGAGERAAHQLADRLIREGRKVSIELPPPGFGDFNDVLMTQAKQYKAQLLQEEVAA